MVVFVMISAKVASLAGRAGWVPIGTVPPADTYSTDWLYEEQCQIGGGSPRSVGLLPADKNTVFGEPEAIVEGAVGTGSPWLLTGWVEGTEVEFMIDSRCQVTILATSCVPPTRVSGPAPTMPLVVGINRLVSIDGTWGAVSFRICSVT